MLMNILEQAISLISTAYVVKSNEKEKEKEKAIDHTEICIIGGGCAAINFSAQILKQKHAIIKPEQIRIIEPTDKLIYQPGQTMVGGCLIPIAEAEKQFTRPNRQFFHKDIKFTKGEVDQIFPDENKFVTKDGKVYSYDQLLIFSGIKPRFDTLKGLQQALDDPNCPVGSIYDFQFAQKNQKLLQNFKGGLALFHEPKGVFKCGGAPSKIVFLAQDYWRKQNLLSKTKIEFWKFALTYFPVKVYSDSLGKLFKQKNIDVIFGEEMIEVIPNEKKAIFQNLKTGQLTTKQFDYLHALPQNLGQDFVAKSGDVGTTFGLVNVNANTLQHVKYKNIWSAGDAANLPTSKTAAAVMSQVPILVRNFISSYKLNKSDNFLKYCGYSACPIFVGEGKLMLAEFKYGMVPIPSFYKNQELPRRQFFLLKKYVFPYVYFNLMHQAKWFGKYGFRNPYP